MGFNMIDSIKKELKIYRDLRAYGRKNPKHFEAQIEQKAVSHALLSMFLPFINIFVNIFFFRLMWQTLCDHPFIIFFIVTFVYFKAFLKFLREDFEKNGLMFLLGVVLASIVVETTFPDRSGLAFGIYNIIFSMLTFRFL